MVIASRNVGHHHWTYRYSCAATCNRPRNQPPINTGGMHGMHRMDVSAWMYVCALWSHGCYFVFLCDVNMYYGLFLPSFFRTFSVSPARCCVVSERRPRRLYFLYCTKWKEGREGERKGVRKGATKGAVHHIGTQQTTMWRSVALALVTFVVAVLHFAPANAHAAGNNDDWLSPAKLWLRGTSGQKCADMWLSLIHI